METDAGQVAGSIPMTFITGATACVCRKQGCRVKITGGANGFNNAGQMVGVF
jgi:hypothetical protein